MPIVLSHEIETLLVVLALTGLLLLLLLVVAELAVLLGLEALSLHDDLTDSSLLTRAQQEGVLRKESGGRTTGFNSVVGVEELS